MESNTLFNLEANQTESLTRIVKSGRKIGILLLLQLFAALMLPFILAKPITIGSPAFLTAATDYSFQIRCAVGIAFIGAALTVWLGIVAFQVFNLLNRSVALLFIIVCTISCVMDLVHASTILSLLSISNQFVASGAASSSFYELIGVAATAARRSAHIPQLFAIGVWMLVFYTSLLRFKLIPKALAVVGILGVVSQFTGVTLMMLLGNPVIGEMAMPLLPIEIVVGAWLIIKGFNSAAFNAETST
jgi:hypothetical protein